jgi:hypothetical protein
MVSERSVLLRQEANELRTGFADHTQNEAGTEQVQPRDQEVSIQKNQQLQTREQKHKHTQMEKHENDKRIHTET